MRMDGHTYVTKLIAAFRNFTNAPQKVLIWTLSAKTRKPKTRAPVLGEGRGAPHYCDHMITQEVSQWGQARTRDPALGAPQHGKAALCHRHWNQANVAAHWWHTVRLACWPPFLVSPARKFLCWRVLNTFSPRIITLTAFHRTAPKNSAFPALSYLFCVDLRAIVQNWAGGWCL